MDFSKVKLVVTDMDGTLLDSKHQVSALFFRIFSMLKKNNIHFIAASGRQHHSIASKLAPIKNDITIIAENGGYGKQGDKELFLFDLPILKIHKTIEVLRTLNTPNIVLCGLKSAYVESTDPEFLNTFSQFYSNYKIVDDLTKIENDSFIKIAVYDTECSEQNILPTVSHLSEELQIIVSGKNWLDISHHDANKGTALKIVQDTLSISKEETMVFGDYNNDLKMLELAHFSYAMENAHPNVKKVANFETKSNDENGVEYILKQVIASN